MATVINIFRNLPRNKVTKCIQTTTATPLTAAAAVGTVSAAIKLTAVKVQQIAQQPYLLIVVAPAVVNMNILL